MRSNELKSGQTRQLPNNIGPAEMVSLIQRARMRLLNDSQSAATLCELFPELECGPDLLSQNPTRVKAGIQTMVDSARPGLFPAATAEIVFSDTVRRRAALQLVAGMIGTDSESWHKGDNKTNSRRALHHLTGLDGSWLSNVSERARQDLYDLVLEMHRCSPSKLLSNIILSGQGGPAAVECWAALNALYQVGELKNRSSIHALLRRSGAVSEGEQTILLSKDLGKIALVLFERVEQAARRRFFPEGDITLDIDGKNYFLCALCRLCGNEAWSSQMEILKAVLKNGRPSTLGSSELERTRDEHIRSQQRVGLNQIQIDRWQQDRASIAVWNLEVGASPTVIDWARCKEYLHDFCQRYRYGPKIQIAQDTFQQIVSFEEPELVHYLKRLYPRAPDRRGQFLLECLEMAHDTNIVLDIIRKMRSLRNVVALEPQALRDISDEFRAVKPRKIPFILVTAATSDPFALLQCGRWVETFSCLDPLCGRDIQVISSNALDCNVKLILSFGIRPGPLVSNSEFDRLLRVANERREIRIDFCRREICMEDGTAIKLGFAARRELIRLGRQDNSSPAICRERSYAQGHVAIDAINAAADEQVLEIANDLDIRLASTVRYPPSRNPLGFYSDNQGGVIQGDWASFG